VLLVTAELSVSKSWNLSCTTGLYVGVAVLVYMYLTTLINVSKNSGDGEVYTVRVYSAPQCCWVGDGMDMLSGKMLLQQFSNCGNWKNSLLDRY